jgi:hypothetical protein
VESVRPLISLESDERMIFWFEANDGRTLIGVSQSEALHPGASWREITLTRRGDDYSVNSETESICIS